MKAFGEVRWVWREVQRHAMSIVHGDLGLIKDALGVKTSMIHGRVDRDEPARIG